MVPRLAPPRFQVTSMAKITSVECSTCSALIEIYRQDVPGEPSLGWTTTDAELCKAPPLRRCPHARADIKRLYPSLNIEAAAGMSERVRRGRG